MKSGLAYRYVREFNALFTESPTLATAAFFGLRFATWTSCGVYYATSSTSLPPELGLAYLITKFSGKFRQPLNLLLSNVLAKKFPILSEIKFYSAATNVFSNEKSKESDTTSKSSEQLTNDKSNLSIKDRITHMSTFVFDSVDKYGFPLFIAGKINVFASVTLASLAIRLGFDVTEILAWLGVSTALQDGASSLGNYD